MLKNIDKWPWEGTYLVIVRDARTGRFLPGTRRCRNLITDAGKNLLRDALGGYVTDVKIRYCAIGTSSTAPAGSQTQLGAEVFRKAVTAYDNTIGTGQVKDTTYIAPGEANVSIQELGWFATSSATATANSGVMIARTLYAHSKTSGESISVQRTDSF